MKAHLLRMTAALAVWSMIIVVPAAAHEGHDAGEKKLFTKHFNESLFDITKNASYSIEILLDDKEYDIGKGVTGIILHNDKDADVTGATVTVMMKNLDSGEPASGTPTVAEKGGGLYLVVTASKDGHEDRAVFILPDVLKKRYKKGRYSP
jgi:hypothetical protein